MLGYDNYATRFESIMSPMGFVNMNHNIAGYPYGGYGAGYGAGYAAGYPMPGRVIDPLMSQRTVDGVIAKDEEHRSNYYGRPIAKHIKDDNVPTVLGILGTALGTIALAIAAKKFKGVKKVKPASNKPNSTPNTPNTPNSTTTPTSTAKPGTPAPNTPNTPNTPHSATSTNLAAATTPGATPGTTPVSGSTPVNPAHTASSSLISPYTSYAKTGKTSQPFIKPVQPRSAEEVIAQEAAENLAKSNINPLIAPYTSYARTGKPSQPFVKPVQPVSYENAVAQQVAEDLAKYGETGSLAAPYLNYAKTGKTSQPFVKPVQPEVIDDFGKYFASLPVAEQQKLYAEIAATGQLRGLDRIANPNGVFKINTQVKATQHQADRLAYAAKKQETAMNLPSSERILTTPLTISNLNAMLAKHNLKLNAESFNALSAETQAKVIKVISTGNLNTLVENSNLFSKLN